MNTSTYFYGLKELAHRWKVSTRTLRRLVARGELPVYRIGAQIRVSEDDVRKFEALQQRGSI